MFLGINAHVNRDLPFVLYRLGMVRDDAGYDDRYEDHQRVDAVLAATRPVAFPQIGLTLDPTIFDPSLLPAMAPDLTDPVVSPTWRQHAWEQAERLAAAPDAAAVRPWPPTSRPMRPPWRRASSRRPATTPSCATG
jgi:hypothetical protein